MMITINCSIFVGCLLLVIVCLQAAPPSITSSDDENEMLISISESIIEVNSYDQQPHRPIERRDDSKKVCYGDLGCFYLDGPMGHTRLLPQSPEHIQTKFYAFKEDHPEQEHLIDEQNPDTFSVIDRSKKLVFISHGYTNDYKCDILIHLKNSLFQHASQDVGTVIMVDWHIGAKGPNYVQAAVNTQLVGRQITRFVNELREKHQLDILKVYLIGFSLGAQVSGYAGKWSVGHYGWKYNRITGLDAAAPLFEGHPGAFLNKDDAIFVDGIHTSIGNNLLMAQLGFTEPYGHVDFYPNGGNHQPMCRLGSGITCNHRAAVHYYDASLTANDQCQFKGYICDTYKDFEHGRCLDTDTILGYLADHYLTANGVRFLNTTNAYPYCNTKYH